MSLIVNEIKLSIEDCENAKKSLLRESDRIREERKCYDHIRHIVGVVEDDEEEDDVR